MRFFFDLAMSEFMLSKSQSNCLDILVKDGVESFQKPSQNSATKHCATKILEQKTIMDLSNFEKLK